MGVFALSFSGGEPLLNPNTCDYIAYAADKGLWTSMPTNGLLIRKYADGVARLDMLEVSIDSLNPQRFAKRRGLDGRGGQLALEGGHDRAAVRHLALDSREGRHEVVEVWPDRAVRACRGERVTAAAVRGEDVLAACGRAAARARDARGGRDEGGDVVGVGAGDEVRRHPSARQ